MNQTIKNRINQIKSGQVPEGYEKTSFGVFPVDWEKRKTLGNIFDFYGGLGIPRDKLGEKGIPYLHYGDMHRNAFTRSWQEIEAIQVPVEHENLDKIFTRAKNNAKVAIKGNSEVNRATFYSSQR